MVCLENKSEDKNCFKFKVGNKINFNLSGKIYYANEISF